MSHARVAAALVLAVVLAGCAGGVDSTTTTAARGPTGTSPAGDRPAGGNASTAAAVAEAVAAIDAVGRYRVRSTLDRTVVATAVTRTVTVESSALVDRDARRLRANLTQRARGRTVAVERYLVDGWVYERRDAYRRRYGSAWVKREVAGAYPVTWRQNDELGIVRALLANGTAARVGTATVRGRPARVLAVTGNATALERSLGGTAAPLALSNVTARVWLDPATGRPLRAVRSLATTQRTGGQTLRYDLTVRASFAYDVSDRVVLDAAARNATDLANVTARGSDS